MSSTAFFLTCSYFASTGIMPKLGKEAAWYNGRHSDDNYLPHFACKATGDALRRVMESHPQSHLMVLCGHTHGIGEVQIMENVWVLTGGAEYRKPLIQRIFEIE
jgi:hypothetical protein